MAKATMEQPVLTDVVSVAQQVKRLRNYCFARVKPCPEVRRGKVFIHFNELDDEELSRLVNGDEIIFDVVPEVGNGKGPAARNVRILKRADARSEAA